MSSAFVILLYSSNEFFGIEQDVNHFSLALNTCSCSFLKSKRATPWEVAPILVLRQSLFTKIFDLVAKCIFLY